MFMRSVQVSKISGGKNKIKIIEMRDVKLRIVGCKLTIPRYKTAILVALHEEERHSTY